jgi:acetylornithine deacetylase
VLTAVERAVTTDIAARRDELIEIATTLIGFDTTAREVGDPPREEAALQGYLADRLTAAGAAADLWEPSGPALAGLPLVPDGLDFKGRPQLVARFAGRGTGSSLLLNGHIDVVSSEPRDQWTTDANRAEVRDGRLYGRGSCDMKGGVAAMTLAAEALARSSTPLAGDLLVATNTDEESSGAGGMALVKRGVHADAGIVPEPTGFDVWIACRGSAFATIDVPGRPGHAEMPQPHWRDGGAVNAIEKASLILDEIRRLREEWRSRDALLHPLLAPTDIVPTVAAAGEWGVTYPASCRLTCIVPYVPAHAGADGSTRELEEEVAARIARVAEKDDWLAEHPPTITWSATVMPMELSADEPVVRTALGAAAAVGANGSPAGLNSWFDGATLTRFAQTPTVAFGPSGLDGGRTIPHTVDESVRIDDLVVCAQALAVTALRFCGAG